jgi:hypothetical protein
VRDAWSRDTSEKIRRSAKSILKPLGLPQKFLGLVVIRIWRARMRNAGWVEVIGYKILGKLDEKV